MSKFKRCGVPSCTLGPCDLPRGHQGIHANAGDGFYARCKICKKELLPDKWKERDGMVGFLCENCDE